MSYSIAGGGLYLMFSPTPVLPYVGQIGRSVLVHMCEHRKALRCDFGKHGALITSFLAISSFANTVSIVLFRVLFLVFVVLLLSLVFSSLRFFMLGRFSLSVRMVGCMLVSELLINLVFP